MEIGSRAVVVFNYSSIGKNELKLKQAEVVTIKNVLSPEWVLCTTETGRTCEHRLTFFSEMYGLHSEPDRPCTDQLLESARGRGIQYGILSKLSIRLSTEI